MGSEMCIRDRWQQTTTSSDGTVTYSMRAARREVGGTWSPARTLRCPGPGDCAGPRPRLGIDAAGAVTAVWTHGETVMTARHPASGGWSRPRVLATSTSDLRPSELQLAVARDGTAVAVWGMNDDAGYAVWAAVRPRGHHWTVPQRLGVGGHPRVGISPQGVAVLAYYRSPHQMTARFQLAKGWSRPRSLDRGYPSSVAVGPRGQALLVSEVGSGYRLVARESTATGAWQARTLLHVPVAWDVAPKAVIDADGTETVAWSAYTDGAGPNVAWVARKPSGDSWMRSVIGSVDIVFTGDVVQLFSNRHNDLVVGYSDQIMLRRADSAWTAPFGGGGAVGILPNGDALRMWWEAGGLQAQRVHLR